MSDLAALPLDELTVEGGVRPAAPDLGGTPADRRQGQRLAMIHAHYRQNVTFIGEVLDRIEAGLDDPAALPAALAAAPMFDNLRRVGTLCGEGCRMLQMHHDIEESHMFPDIDRKAPPGIAAVVVRLREEHQVIHELLRRLDAAAVQLEASPNAETFAAAHAVFDALAAAVESHFGYEETELEEALRTLRIAI
jgi:hypothetical protein